MGECGCGSNAERFKFDGPDKVLYVLTLFPHCTYCDGPSSVRLEKFTLLDDMYAIYADTDDFARPLKFDSWSDSLGVLVVTGKTKNEFSGSLRGHLVGTSAIELGDSDGIIDEIAAETLLDEMYDDAQTTPTISR